MSRSNGHAGAGIELDANCWHWKPADPAQVVYVGALDGSVRPPGANLVMRSTGAFDALHFRGQGTFTWHLLRTRDGLIAALDPGTPALGVTSVLNDLFALEFVMGASIDVPLLVAYDRAGSLRGALALGRLGPATRDERCPVPNAYDEPGCWAAPLFSRAAIAVARDKGLDVAIAGYLDALRGHIHGGYLLAQVALEVFCKSTQAGSAEPSLVKSQIDWKAWISSHQGEIQALADGPTAAATLMNKLLHNVIEAPKGRAVTSAFSHWGIALPPILRQEIGLRNRSAHEFYMFDETNGDVQKAADRVDRVQTLLTAAISSHVGYTGPIVGWERDNSGWLQPATFWTQIDMREAHERFVCQR
jgi:hypothetical protein